MNGILASVVLLIIFVAVAAMLWSFHLWLIRSQDSLTNWIADSDDPIILRLLGIVLWIPLTIYALINAVLSIICMIVLVKDIWKAIKR